VLVFHFYISALPPKNRFIPGEKKFFSISSLGKISEMKKTGFKWERPLIQHRYIEIDGGNIMPGLSELIRKCAKNS